jgi:hypothetical protein
MIATVGALPVVGGENPLPSSGIVRQSLWEASTTIGPVRSLSSRWELFHALEDNLRQFGRLFAQRRMLHDVAFNPITINFLVFFAVFEVQQ